MEAVIATILPLAVLSPWIFPGAEGAVTITGCTDAFIHLQCPVGDRLSVHSLQLGSGLGGVCPQVRSREPPRVPPNLVHLCTAAEKCLYEEDICVGKDDCVFYIRGQFMKRNGQVSDSSSVSITYTCDAGPAGFGAITGISVVTLALVVALIGTTLIICRRGQTSGRGGGAGGDQQGEDNPTSRYVQFDNDPVCLSRSPSAASELQHKPPSSHFSSHGPAELQLSMADASAHYYTIEGATAADPASIRTGSAVLTGRSAVASASGGGSDVLVTESETYRTGNAALGNFITASESIGVALSRPDATGSVV